MVQIKWIQKESPIVFIDVASRWLLMSRLLVLWYAVVLIIVIEFLLVIEPGPGEVAPDGVDDEEQESEHE